MIETNKELHLKNVISVRRKMTQIELGIEAQNIKKLFDESKLSVKTLSSITYSVNSEKEEKPLLDVELIAESGTGQVPLHLPESYTMKPEIKVVNALFVKYEGTAAGLQSVYNELNAYIANHKLQPVTPAFSVSLNPFANTQEKVNIDIYVGINPNIL